MIRFKNRYYNTGRVFNDIDKANSFMEMNREYGVVGEIKRDTIIIANKLKIYVAKHSDNGHLKTSNYSL